MKRPKKKLEERKEIKILRVVKEDQGKIKEEREKEQVIDPAALETFIAPRDDELKERPVALLKETSVENLEEELALVPRAPTREEENPVKYGPASGMYGGEGGYGDFGGEWRYNRT